MIFETADDKGVFLAITGVIYLLVSIVAVAAVPIGRLSERRPATELSPGGVHRQCCSCQRSAASAVFANARTVGASVVPFGRVGME